MTLQGATHDSGVMDLFLLLLVLALAAYLLYALVRAERF